MPLPNITDFLCQKSETIRRYANVYVFKRITTMEQEIVSHEYPLLNNILISVYEWLRLYLVNSVYHKLAYFYHLIYRKFYITSRGFYFSQQPSTAATKRGQPLIKGGFYWTFSQNWSNIISKMDFFGVNYVVFTVKDTDFNVGAATIRGRLLFQI